MLSYRTSTLKRVTAIRWRDLYSLFGVDPLKADDKLTVILLKNELDTRSRVIASTTYYLEELRHRRQSRVAANDKEFTRWIFWLTLVVNAVTVNNVIVTICTGVRCQLDAP